MSRITKEMCALIEDYYNYNYNYCNKTKLRKEKKKVGGHVHCSKDSHMAPPLDLCYINIDHRDFVQKQIT